MPEKVVLTLNKLFVFDKLVFANARTHTHNNDAEPILTIKLKKTAL